MAYSGCKPNTLYFSDTGFTFVSKSGEISFPAHLENDDGSIALFAIDACLGLEERQHAGASLSDVITLYFKKIAKRLEGHFDPKETLTVVRPFQFSTVPALEGLAVVRLKQSLFLAFPECKLRFQTPDQLEPRPERMVHYSFESTTSTERTVRGGASQALFDSELKPVFVKFVDQVKGLVGYEKAVAPLKERYGLIENWNFIEYDPLVRAISSRHSELGTPLTQALARVRARLTSCQ